MAHMGNVSETIVGPAPKRPVVAVEIAGDVQVAERMIDTAKVAVYDPTVELPAEVQAFIAGYAGDELCLNATWFDLLMRYSPAAGQKPRLYVIKWEDGRAIDGVMFAMGNGDETRRPRKLTSLSNFYSMSYAPLLRRDLIDKKAPLDLLAAYIVRERPAWDLIEILSLIEEDPATGDLVRAFRQAGVLVDTFAQFENWYYPSSGVSAEQYFATRPPPVRAVARKMRQAQKKHEVSFQLYQSLENLAIGIQDYEQVYAHSWKEPEVFPAFIPQLLRRFAEQGNLRLGILRLDGAPAAAQIWLISGRRATIYKVAYDEKFAPLSAGSLLSKFIFDHVLDHDKVAEIDYGVGSERYKLDWMSECRHVVGLIGFNPRSRIGLTEAARHFAGRLRRRWGHGTSP
jgi:hypothetical protein